VIRNVRLGLAERRMRRVHKQGNGEQETVNGEVAFRATNSGLLFFH